MTHLETNQMVYAGVILLLFLVVFLLIINYSNNSEVKSTMDKNNIIEEKKMYLNDYVDLVNTLIVAYDIFSKYITVMNENAIPMFEAMNKYCYYDTYVKAMNEASNLLNTIYNDALALQAAINVPKMNETLVKNLVYNIRHNMKELYKEINKGQYQLLYVYEKVLKYDHLYQQFSGNIYNILQVQTDSHLAIANYEYRHKIEKKYYKIMNKLGYHCDKKVVDEIQELYEIFCSNFYHWYDKNID